MRKRRSRVLGGNLFQVVYPMAGIFVGGRKNLALVGSNAVITDSVKRIRGWFAFRYYL